MPPLAARRGGTLQGRVRLAFQRPMAIPGVRMADFLRHAATNVRRPDRKEGEELIPMREFRARVTGSRTCQLPFRAPRMANRICPAYGRHMDRNPAKRCAWLVQPRIWWTLVWICKPTPNTF